MNRNSLVIALVAITMLCGIAATGSAYPRDTIKTYPAWAPADSTTPFAIYQKVDSVIKPYFRIKIYDYRGMQTGLDYTWGDSTKAMTGTPVWTISNSVAYGYAGNVKKAIGAGMHWEGWLVGKVSGDSADLRVRLREEDNDSIWSNSAYQATWTVGQQKLNMQTNGGWLKGHIYTDPTYVDGLQNVAVLAFQGTAIAGIYLTENNSVGEGHDSTDAGYFRMAVPAGQIDSLQIRDLTNAVITGFWKTTAPWMVTAANETNIDASGVAGLPANGLPALRLLPAQPNPAVNGTVLKYALPADGSATLVVFDVVGQKVATLASGVQSAGMHQVRWTLRDDQGNLVPNGIYFYQLTTGTSKETRKMTVVR